jgi:hypothetical protein
MKKIVPVIVLVLFVFNANSQWYQKKYGVTDINELRVEQLNYSLEKAETNIKTGKILTYTGLGFGVIGIIVGTHATLGIFNNDIDKTLNEYTAGGMLILGGMGAMAVGIPFWIVGASRRNQIEVALIKFNNLSSLGNFNPATLSIKQPTTIGLSLKIDF